MNIHIYIYIYIVYIFIYLFIYTYIYVVRQGGCDYLRTYVFIRTYVRKSSEPSLGSCWVLNSNKKARRRFQIENEILFHMGAYTSTTRV